DGADADALSSAPKTVTRVVSAGYFETVGSVLKAGRTFQPADQAASARVAIVSESMARFYLKDQNPIGRHISWKQFNGQWTQPAEIVGVVADSRADGIMQTPLHTLYQPNTQVGPVSNLLVRTAGIPDQLAPRMVET